MPRSPNSVYSDRLTFAELTYVKLQKIADYILYELNGGRSDASIRQTLDQKKTGSTRSGEGHHARVEGYLKILLKGQAIFAYGGIYHLWQAYLQEYGNTTRPVNHANTLDALRKFQVATCIDRNYRKLPPTYHMAAFFTLDSDVQLPLATRTEIEGNVCIPDYGLGIRGGLVDMINYAAKQ